MATQLHSAPTDREQQVLLRIGAACAIVGPLVLGASFAPHGDLPTNEASLLGESAALRYIADHELWYAAHMGTIVAALLWLGAFTALARTLAPGAARAVGWLLVPSAVIGVVFVIFDYSVDGYALKLIADEWAAASGADQEALLRMTETGIWMLSGTFRSEIVVFYGLTFVLAGSAVALDGRYPRAFGWIGAAAGALFLVNGLAGYAGVELAPSEGLDFLVFLVIIPLEVVWLLAVGVLMWRHASRQVTTGRG